MSRTLDAIRKAEKERLLSPEELRLFNTKAAQRVSMESEFANVQGNGQYSISVGAMEEYNRLKQSIVNLLPEEKQRVLLFAGAGPGDGSSRVATNFSMVLASSGERLLLVDANLRSPALHGFFAIGKNPGLAELLSGEATLRQVIRPTHFRNLLLVTAGGLPQNPFPLFGNGKADSAIRQMKGEADWVIFDAPAVNVFNDAVSLGAKTDGVALVVQAEKTRWEVAKNARQRLESGKANVLGVVLNDRKLHIPAWMYRRL